LGKYHRVKIDDSAVAAVRVPDGCMVRFKKVSSKYAKGGIGRKTQTGLYGCQYICLQNIRSDQDPFPSLTDH